MKKSRSFFALIIFISIICIFSSSVSWAEILKRDDFQDQKSWWTWGATCTSLPTVHDGMAHLIQESASRFQNCGTYLWDGENIYQYYTATIRVKTLTPMRPGSLGWGFWDYNPPFGPGEIADADVSWFMKQYDPYDSSKTWWIAGTRNGNSQEFSYDNLVSIVDTEARKFRCILR